MCAENLTPFPMNTINYLKATSIVCVLLSTSQIQAQTITSNQDGPWNATSTWIGGVIPTTTNSTSIVVNHNVSIPSGYSVTVDGLTLNGQLTINTGGTLSLLSQTSPGFVQNHVYGTLVRQNTSNLTGATGSNLIFESGSTYNHLFTTTQGAVPLAFWNANSTVLIQGYTSVTTATAAGNWSQPFGNVTWNCISQTGTFNMNGLLTTVTGNLRILNTGTGIFQMATSQNPTVSIGGNLSIEGNSRVRLSTTGAAPGTVYNITGSFMYSSVNPSGSDITTSGVCTLNIYDFNMDAAGGLLAISRNGIGSLNIIHNYELIGGTFSEIGVGSGNINFIGPNLAHTFSNTGTISTASLLRYTLPASHSLRVLGESQIMGGAGSSLTVGGTLIVESENSTGAIITGSGTGVGNIRVVTRTFNVGSRIVYGGSNPQFIGNGHPSASGVDAEIDNASGVSIELGTPASLTLGRDLYVTNGNLTIANDNLVVSRDAHLNGGNLILATLTTTARSVQVNGNLDLSGGNVEVNSGNGNAIVIINGTLSGTNNIVFNGNNCNLQINGTGNLGRDFPLQGPASIEAITVNRAAGTVVFSQNVTTLNLTISNGNVDMNAPLVVNDDLNLATGTTLFIEDQVLELRSQFNNRLSGGYISSNENSTLNILNAGTLGTLTFSPTGNSLGSFLLNRPTGGTLVTLNSELTVLNTFTLADGIFNNISGLTFGSGAAVTRNSAASFTSTSLAPSGGPYNLTYTGGSMLTGVEIKGAVNNITCSAGTVTLTSSLLAQGEFTLTSGTFTCGINPVSIASLRNLTGTFNAPRSTLTISGNILNNSTFNRNNGTIVFNGNTTIAGAVNPSFQNIVINGSLTAPAVLNVHGAFTNEGNFVAGNGTVAFLGTASVSQVISGGSITRFNNMTVSNTTAAPDVRIENRQELIGVLTLATNATVDADGGTNSGVFTVLSTSDNPSIGGAIAALSGTAQVQGNVTIQRYMSIEGGSNSPFFNNGRIYRYISSPVQNALVQDIQNEIPITGSFTGTSICTGCNTSQSMFSYNESVITDTNGNGVNDINDGYLDFPLNSNTETLTTGRGYAIFVRGNIDPIASRGNALWDVRNPINAGAVNFTPLVSYTSSGNNANDGWNLVGNPYPSTIDWNASTGWTKTGLNNTIYMADNSVSPLVYATFNGTVGTNGGSRYIPIGQAFFVKSNGGPITFSCSESVKAPSSQGIFFREATPSNLLRVTLSQGNYRDETVIHFREDATEQFDSHADAYKLPNEIFNLSTVLKSGQKASINSLPFLKCENDISLDISNAGEGHYKLIFSEIESFDNGATISLLDNFLGRRINLNEFTIYDFDITSDVKSFGMKRFVVRISPKPHELDIFSQDIICKGNDALITIKGTEYNSYAAKLNDSVMDSVYGYTGSITLRIPQQKLNAGINEISLLGWSNQCNAVPAFRYYIPLHVEEIQQAAIEIQDNMQLVSNYKSGNTWYYNGLIKGTDVTLPIEAFGMYELVVESKGCLTKTSKEIIASENSSLPGLIIYPNPVTYGKLLTIKLEEADCKSVFVTNSLGNRVGQVDLRPSENQGYIGTFDLSLFPSGLYFINFDGEISIKVLNLK